MTEEQKQALIERCEQKIKQLSKVEVGIMHTDKLDLLIYCEAIAALTAQPVKAPEFAVHANQPCWPSIAVGMRDGEWKQALRAQGYQVEGE